ncbi:hypothetical protein IPZ61_16870 [Streptomyces sioyaensis]|uniref:hypothetical protein n=1 Tax=Streptomyces sioyaensis TaxID=67364 RepID=UPI001F27E8BF|nr:hypothetical protein [Streptomyces sioyaensis]MCF3174984.1 hypothetical protein [Streptomyces sioyaensis]
MEHATTLRELRPAGEKRTATTAVPDECRAPMPLRGPEGRSATGAAFREAGVRVPRPLPVGPLPAKPTEIVENWL